MQINLEKGCASSRKGGSAMRQGLSLKDEGEEERSITFRKKMNNRFSSGERERGKVFPVGPNRPGRNGNRKD